ncbi:unnamed protein product [Rotaria magnacalcarata]|uniref:Uncharacterized protein n=1 Tax=Rotaria magnacalcarata TaxID=392030 RepID=A0A816YPV5_9BILA|nr:unnamed protein product [Rotaria magnacalcarata]CAF2163922.1 unnamed protein product [Rotaria magnacalcarata]CAF3808304.1 unnamed protein product [Rotaria magnacalcarata]CAF4110911.1 unnamed protein product [Rotaria magnacalcarata]
MTRIPIITQNFSSPDGFNDTPLMLLPQASTLPVSDKDQEGFSQLLLHDLHRHRQTYVRNFTAFETLKKRQDFILRQENLRSLLNFEQRMTVKQDQYIDQTFHSYEQCFVKVINANSTNTTRTNQEQPKRPQTAGPSFGKFHTHQLSHQSNTTQESTVIKPFQRYQKTHRPSLTSKYRCQSSVQHSAQSYHDAFQSPSFSTQTQPFLSFTENYLQKYGDRSTNRLQTKTNTNGIQEIKERNDDDDDDEHIHSTLIELNPKLNPNKRQNQKSRTPDLQHGRASALSRNTNTPSSTPQTGYHDALRDGLTIVKDDDDHNHKMSVNNEKRRSSQQSTSQTSNGDNRTSIKRPKTAKKKHVTVDLTSEKRKDSLTNKNIDDDLFQKVMIVQNYGSNNNSDLNPMDRFQIQASIPMKRISSDVRRSSTKSNESNQDTQKSLDNIDTQITSKIVSAPTPEPVQTTIDNHTDQTVEHITDNIAIIDNMQPVQDQSIEQKPVLEFAANRKRVKKSAFDPGETMSDMMAFELGIMGSSRSAIRKSRTSSGKENHQNGDEPGVVPENQETLDLLEKIRQSSNSVSVGQMIASQQGCRFELPYDLKLLETLTPLDYLSKYCRLSTRRNYQFKRIFDKHRNNHYRFESNNLFTSIGELHRDNFTRSQFEYLCQLIDIGTEQHQFTYDTFSGILALCERILCETKRTTTGLDEQDLAKDTLEKCDFDSLDRKLDGLKISATMKKLLTTL